MLKAKRKSGSVKFLSNEKEYTILSLFLWVEGGEEVYWCRSMHSEHSWQMEGKFEMGNVHLAVISQPMGKGEE